ncbi:MAG TPA: hypothetical protein VKQ36_07870 [Ktedonobacterales bacterium]|nr:hypothetical protein [Ktedonobacterales bacterium]
MAWVVMDYQPVSIFSLRPAQVTASGGKSLLTPTGFALKMALLNASIQTAGLEEGKRRFPIIRDLQIALDLPDHITAIKSFAKVRRLYQEKEGRDKANDEKEEEFKLRMQAKVAAMTEEGDYPFQPTIAYREFVQFGDPLAPAQANAVRVACAHPSGATPDWVGDALLAVNYLGKRGGFFQPMRRPSLVEQLNDAFTEITRDSEGFSMQGTLQMLDDCGPTMTFDHADIYSTKRITLGKERVLRHVVLPYRLARSSRGYSFYERV